ANSIGKTTVTFPDGFAQKIDYSILSSDYSSINGISSFTLSPSTYNINHVGKQLVTATHEINNGYRNPTSPLVVSGETGVGVSNITWNRFNINPNSYGNITVTPAAPLLNTYNIKLNIVNIPQYSSSGIDT